MTRVVDLHELARLVPPASKVALPTDFAGVSMAVTRPLIQLGRRDLHLVCVPIGSMQADMLIGAGLVSTLETSAVSLGEAGAAPRFTKAVKEGAIRMLDATCPAVYTGLVAAQKGVPFLPMRGLIGTDVLANRPDWRVIENPFSDEPDPIVAIPAITPDVAIFHAPAADRFGNILIGRRRELALMAYASRRTLVTVERIVEGSLLETEQSAAGVLPALYVEAIAIAPHGAAPCGLWDEYPADFTEVARYARAARSDDGFREYLSLSRPELEPA
jgi:glutaconate CoA-transferase subunit A